MRNAEELLVQLQKNRSLSLDEYAELIRAQTPALAQKAAELAQKEQKKIYGNRVFVRGLIEIGNLCRNDCLYCGIRKSNTACNRYRLTEEQILGCCDEGYALGFRTFVLQGGEGGFSVDFICETVKKIKAKFPDCAVTLSLGEFEKRDYQKMFDAGADRYLLRHETADKAHYEKLHPSGMSFEHRMQCLRDLKEIGFQVGCGFMVGSPFQAAQASAKDLKFIEEFRPDMCGIGPFIPHRNTPFKNEAPGTVRQTCYLLSLLRLIRPNLLLPATTALGTLDPIGREKGILAGANVVMPNLSPVAVRKKYELYDNKLFSGAESAQCLKQLTEKIRSVGYRIVTDRGDIKK
ncbi:MAG TPA: [FeFe] hydrogenase H-cluster radical SAM maturase HydE [Ruminococcaceae bacterium]|nr:[FeFe] hydrogenase H-cluster radical SAM maturase HydE [Oscillospiraceae bacterium]